MTKQYKNRDNLIALQALEAILAQQGVSKKHIYFQNFMRGIFFSIGSIAGVVLVGSLLLWVLSLFDTLPFVNQISESIKSSL